MTPAGKIRYAKQQQKEKQEREYEEALSIIDQQLKRIPFSRAALSSLKYANPMRILGGSFSDELYKAVLARNVAEIVLARSVFTK